VKPGQQSGSKRPKSLRSTLIRQDLYSGQPCAPGGEPYVFRALIGYYECVHA
jgi:hypothetical protein